MKVKLVERETEEKFEPFSIEITFETQKEADRFYAMAGTLGISKWLSSCLQEPLVGRAGITDGNGICEFKEFFFKEYGR